MSEDVVFNASVDQLLENLPIGSMSKAIGNNLYGFNHRQTPNALPRNKDENGFLFMTRPGLRLDVTNVSNYRGFYSLLTDKETSYQRYVRLMLDPLLALEPGHANFSEMDGQLFCPFVDPQSAFIPLLTNSAVSVSGWPDVVAPVKSFEAGQYDEQYEAIDGVVNDKQAFDVNVTFRNTLGSPLMYMLYIWVKYQTLVYEGVLWPYQFNIFHKYLDYCTRIYRVLLDHRKRYVTYIGYTGASFPTTVPTGSLFDYNIDKPFSLQNSELIFRFRSIGFKSFEDVVKLHFNQAMGIFNPYIRKLIEYDMTPSRNVDDKRRENDGKIYSLFGITKVPYSLNYLKDSLSIGNNPFYNLNYKCWPYINLITNEFEWWVLDSRAQALKELFPEQRSDG